MSDIEETCNLLERALKYRPLVQVKSDSAGSSIKMIFGDGRYIKIGYPVSSDFELVLPDNSSVPIDEFVESTETSGTVELES